MANLHITHLPPAALGAYGGNVRTHRPNQIAEIASSIKAFGFNKPVLVDKASTVITGTHSLFETVGLRPPRRSISHAPNKPKAK